MITLPPTTPNKRASELYTNCRLVCETRIEYYALQDAIRLCNQIIISLEDMDAGFSTLEYWVKVKKELNEKLNKLELK